MAMELPDYIDPRRFAEQGLALLGYLPAHKLLRLPGPFRAEHVVQVDLRFAVDDGRICVRGSITTQLDAVCQRCLSGMRLSVAQHVDTVVVSERAALEVGNDEERDLVIAEDGSLRLVSFVEDEILLALPMVPMHGDGVCEPPGNTAVVEPTVVRRPFGDLAELLRQKGAK